MHRPRVYTPDWVRNDPLASDPRRNFSCLDALFAGTWSAVQHLVTDREAKSRAVKILAKSIYRDLEAQGFDEKQIVALATELISEVTSKISRDQGQAKITQQLA